VVADAVVQAAAVQVAQVEVRGQDLDPLRNVGPVPIILGVGVRKADQVAGQV
jgi:hypothetical protein